MEHLYKRKFIIVLIIGLIILACLKGNAQSRFKDIPAPILDNNQNLEIAQGSTLTIQGSGFINNYPTVHKVSLLKYDNHKIEKCNLKVLSSNASFLTVEVPSTLELGDYDLAIKIKSKLLQSKPSKYSGKLKIRPQAAAAPMLDYQVLASTEDIADLLANNSNLIKEINGSLQIGPNQIFQTYSRDGFQSIRSPMTSFFYLPETSVENQLKIDSETPLKSFAIERSQERKFDVSNITQAEVLELSKSFFLKSKSNPRYLEYSVKLSPVFFEQVHAFEDEFAIIKNRSSSDFSLIGCNLADSIQNRYKFGDKDAIPAHQSLTITQNLGLNNSSPDSLKLLCPDGVTKLPLLIDEFKYEKVDAEGFAIRHREAA